MPKLSEPLRFYVKHAADIGALWAEGEKPDGVGPDEWKLFEEVLEELKSDADTLLRRLFLPLETGLLKGFTAIGKRPYKVREHWDYYREFKPTGKGNRGVVGFAGVQIVDESSSGNSFLVVYVSASPSGKPEAPPSVIDRCPKELTKALPDRLVLASVQLTNDVDEESLATLVTSAAPNITAVLESLNK